MVRNEAGLLGLVRVRRSKSHGVRSLRSDQVRYGWYGIFGFFVEGITNVPKNIDLHVP